ncbi:MAG: hypothetical protein IPP71_23840 [Bacteroidetes bacterium]|nr:hypothetical protein [Bacteroidota bacterium]
MSFQQTDSIISLALGAVTRNVPLIISIGPWQFPFPPAVINPHNKLKWCTSYGLSGFANDNFSDCHIDPADNVYVVGQTFNPNFPIFQNIQPYIGSADISVVKFLPGRNRAFSTIYGGSSVDFGNAIRIDYDGNILFTGSTISVDFPPCPTCLTPQSTLGGKLDAYVVKLTPNGQTQLLSTYYGLTENDFGYGIAVDKINNIYLVGGTAGGVPIPASQPANSFYSDFTANNNAGMLYIQDGFVAKITSSNVLEWATHYGSDGTNNPAIKNEYIASIDFDEVGNNFYVMGVTSCDKVQVCAAPCSTDVSPDFPITGSNYIYDTPNGEDYFIVKFNSSLQVTWSTLWGGDLADVFTLYGITPPNRAIAVSPYNDDLVIVGFTSSTNLETMDMGGSSYFDGTPSAGFIASFDSNDNLKWSTYYKGETRSVSANTLGQFIVTGSTDNATLDLVQSNLGAYYQPLNNGNFDGFYLKFNSGSILNHATYIGGAQNDYLMSSSIQKSNGSNSISVGFTRSSNFPWRDFIPNYNGDYSLGDPGLTTTGSETTPFVFNLYNVSTPLRIASPDEFSEETVKPKSNCVIYPNPFTNVVHFKTTEILKEITIYDLAGQQLVHVDAPFNDYSTIDLTAYAPEFMAEVVTTAKESDLKL